MSGRALLPELAVHQLLEADPSPPTFSFFTNVVPAQVIGWKRYVTLSCMPFCAASVTAWVQGVAATMAMKTSGFLEANVVMGSVIVGVEASIVSVAYEM